MGNWATVSTKVRREVLEKARQYGINVSEVLRNALEEEVRRREEEELKRKLTIAAEELKKVSTEEVVDWIKEMRRKR
ncbi:type II toxin-antitoxin system CcdA family antitoxin [Sulfolobus acidocaldarius]|uniref:Conserved protein n=4 Tax=Sulfolobus acidocaldarius TaxID=2285 RepID=Q4J758_SULAC|nr:type II toxin-antitoxin system CcdA family antitoxin [Sulfolobus acidocaldarius]AAY81373.1 conserved protein [Sulfolobus acidocaldarius DSM 639]AGE71972.1 hypothetical protein SacN8_10110 [Sulfolobus acidocaldarius N8]AGE74288.1 hypothetical protein SacRon12I_10360 [Sulfolobus acidocaldarius Ron12/I]ALU29830.1 hypothetical protein ATY89_07685 [Sulfolobus acidocaldarius]ALU32569.1 hypothetical protein ATZ20_10705 [Sulfolobus acidocaldarius]